MTEAAWTPQPGPQFDALQADWCEELLFGGAAGGGKSDLLLGDFLQDVPVYGPLWKGVIFRRTYPELEELIGRAHEVYPESGARWHKSEKTWTWPTGSALKMRYLERDTDVTRYQGHQYSWIGWDELTQWPSHYCYKYLRTRLRSAGHVPRKRIRSATNPVGVGYHWVKSYFVDYSPTGYKPRTEDQTGHKVMFIPSLVQDNKILMENDPGYINRLAGAGSPELVKALLTGSWDVVQGAFFPEFSVQQHVVAPIKLPEKWVRFRCFDWGSARPFACYWCAVSDGDLPQFPKGSVVVYREWYGASEPNVGLRLTSDEISRGIRERELDSENIHYSVADPACFHRTDGPSIAERMGSYGVVFNPADNDRVGGWDQLRARLKGEDGRPMLYLFSTCTALIRTLPALQHDDKRPEDCNTDGEDHGPDALRYGLMSRPYNRPPEETLPRIKPLHEMTFNDLLADIEHEQAYYD